MLTKPKYFPIDYLVDHKQTANSPSNNCHFLIETNNLLVLTSKTTMDFPACFFPDLIMRVAKNLATINPFGPLNENGGR